MVPSSSITIEVLATLALSLLASSAVFWVLVRRWESHREILAFLEWGAQHGLRPPSDESDNLAAPLTALHQHRPQVIRSMSNPTLRLMQVLTAPVPHIDGTPGAGGQITWNILIRRIGSSWTATGLRPTTARRSLLDLFSLSSFPTMGANDRFTIFSADSAAARALAGSMSRSLLPPDIGLLLSGNHLVLDFSQRPFDEIEFNRMMALAEQLAEKLPVPMNAGK
jgi:hypothetical protein